MIEFEHVFYSYNAPSTKRKRRKNRTGQQSEDAKWGNSPDAQWALRDISFQLRDGDFFGIAGHTGSGKSTLIQHMNGLLHPTMGRVLVDGTDIAEKGADAKARANVGLVFQYPERQLFASSVFEDVAFGPRNMGMDANEVEAAYQQSMEVVGLDAEALQDVSPFELSGGQQRRVAFAGVLSMRPNTLILDEPVAGLDPRSRESFLTLIAGLHRDLGITVVMVSHAMDDLARFCNRVLVLNRGEQFALGAPDVVFSDAERLKSVGLGAPSAQRMANALEAAGCTVQNGGRLFTIDTLADAIAASVHARERQMAQAQAADATDASQTEAPAAPEPEAAADDAAATSEPNTTDGTTAPETAESATDAAATPDAEAPDAEAPDAASDAAASENPGA